ncbi:unnamed protein product [Dovyalis caffra]|uniref:cytochrome-b5 reductase n=1 Tax=Dovyalis caffra TaxID=77055 RepID=A0AAV1QVM1_9ROSI|nr:unnamed protein product [Dovyalis caffra]
MNRQCGLRNAHAYQINVVWFGSMKYFKAKPGLRIWALRFQSKTWAKNMGLKISRPDLDFINGLKKFKEFKLVKKTPISPNVAKFRFSLPTPKAVLGLPVGKHVVCRGKDGEGQEVTRPYTPITLDSDVGYFELVVKMYPKGRMSHHFREMCEGEYLAVKGPQGRFNYKPGQARAFGMIAGGSGITPIFQLTRAILENPKDKTCVHLIYANTTVEDILLKEELDAFASKFPNRFKVYYVLSQPPEAWNGGVGYVSKEIIQNYCPAPASDIQVNKSREYLKAKMVKNMESAKCALGLMLLVLSLGAEIADATISCLDALATLTPCLPFLLGLPPTPSDACCAGAQKLDKLAATSPVDRKSLCECFVSAVKSYPANPQKVQQLPKLCQLQVTLPDNPDVDCSK